MPHSTPPSDSDTRSLPRVTAASRQPSPSAPIRWSTGMRTSVRNISLKCDCPVISVIGRTSTPGVVMSSTKYEMPLCFGADGSVRASRMPKSERSAHVDQIFWPFTT